MADKAIGELIAAEKINQSDLFVLEQDGAAKKLPGRILENWLLAMAQGHGGIHSIDKVGTSGLVDTYRITLADTSYFDFPVTNGKSITDVKKSGTAGLVDAYTIRYNDGSTSTFTVTNGAKGDKGDNSYTWIKYASQEPTEASHSMGDIPDDWRGEYNGPLAEAPTDWKQYKWYKIKGEKGDTGSPSMLVSRSVTYQVGDSGIIIPSGAWGSSIPVVPQGKYLWTKTEIKFNSGDPIVSYVSARQGLDGSGSVASVAGVSPDSDGNVTLTAADVGALPSSGGSMTGPINMNGQTISGLNDPVEESQAARKGYVDAAVRKAAPRNLLDNSDFRNPVNQRGKSSYSGAGYAIDRWLNASDGTVSVAGNALTLEYVTFRQLLDIAPGNYTFAFKVNGVVCMIVAAFDGSDFTYRYTSNHTFTGGYISLAYHRHVIVQIIVTAGHTATIEWAALYEGEYTAETLPEYQPKGYAAELLECQRYLQRFRTSDLRKTYCEDFRPTMRMTDTGIVSTFEQSIDGVTYYFASAEM